jgi:hypothetical protein
MQPPPSKACPRCGEEKPRDPAHWYRDKSRRDGLARICSACAGEDLRRAKARARARQREMPASRGDLADLVLPSRAPLAAPLNFRTVLEEKARQRWPKLADTLLDLAEAGDKGALKLVVEQLIGHPTPARDDVARSASGSPSWPRRRTRSRTTASWTRRLRTTTEIMGEGYRPRAPAR